MKLRETSAPWWPLLGLLALLPACAMGGEKPETRNPKLETPKLSPEEQAANDLIRRFKAEAKVKQELDQQLAAQHFSTGKMHFDHGAWKPAYDHFRKALQFDPTHKEAQEYLRKTASLLGIKEGRGGLMGEYFDQQKVLLESQKMELANLLAAAKAAYAKGQFAEALELFVRVKAKAQYLAPQLDTAPAAQEAEQQIGKVKSAIGQQRTQTEQERRRQAAEEAERLRKGGQSLLLERQQAQLAQARSLFGERRYDQARKLCDEVLRHDPSNGVATNLRESALQAARTEAIDGVLRSRAAELAHWNQQLSAQTVPQNDIVSISRERLEELRNRKGDLLYESGIRPPEEWETRIRALLEKKVTFDFIETPLADVVSFLATMGDVSMVLDTEALKGGMPNVSLRVQDMRMGTALNWICKLVGLRYVLRDEAIFISRTERILVTPVLRMYDITDLTIEIKNFKGRHQALATDSGFGPEPDVRGFFGEDDEKDEADKPLSGPALIEFLKRIVAPTGTEDDGGMDRLREVAGLPRDERPGKAQEIVDLIGITVGGRTFLGVKTKE